MSTTTDPRKVALDELVDQAQELKLDYQPTVGANPTPRRRSILERWVIRYLMRHGWSPRFGPSGYINALIEDEPVKEQPS